MSAINFCIGDTVEIKGMSQSGIITKILKDGRCIVSLVNKTITCSPSLLKKVKTSVQRKSSYRVDITSSVQSSRKINELESFSKKVKSSDLEFDFHGLTRERAMQECEKLLNMAVLNGINKLKIVHGKSGHAVKEAVWKVLVTSGVVKNYQIDSQNQGVTIIYL
jgi:dsDNA-specific endonuclease/ATPase MutS2